EDDEPAGHRSAGRGALPDRPLPGDGPGALALPGDGASVLVYGGGQPRLRHQRLIVGRATALRAGRRPPRPRLVAPGEYLIDRSRSCPRGSVDDVCPGAAGVRLEWPGGSSVPPRGCPPGVPCQWRSTSDWNELVHRGRRGRVRPGPDADDRSRCRVGNQGSPDLTAADWTCRHTPGSTHRWNGQSAGQSSTRTTYEQRAG